MFIRKIKTRTQNGTDYFAFRLVESVRIGDKVRQRTLLNLGSDFSLPREQWNELIAAIEAQRSTNLQLLSFPEPIARLAERIEAQLSPSKPAQKAQHHRVDLKSMHHRQLRSIGGETVALHALQQLKFEELLASQGIQEKRRKLAIAQVVARMVHPSSERESFRWLCDDSALCELLGLSMSQLKLGALYRSADVMYRHREAIERAMYQRQCELFKHTSSVMLYDLTNTYFSGQAHLSPGQFGRSKQKRHDCPLVTLGLCLDESGLVRRCEVLPGNVSEPTTLARAVERLGAGGGSLTVVMDAGLCTEANLKWLDEAGHDWVAVVRKRAQMPDTDADVETVNSSRERIRIWRLDEDEKGQVQLCVHSAARQKTERSMLSRARQRFEDDLKYLNEGLGIRGRLKRHDRVVEKIGRLRERHKRVSAQYDIVVKADDKARNAIAVSWTCNHKHQVRDDHAGSYLLRTSLSDWDDERIVRLYWTLSEVEATFRTLKSELGMRPIYHHNKSRVAAHLFISVVAYQAVHYLRLMLRGNGVRSSWNTVRNKLSTLHRLTTVMDEANGQQIRVRQNSDANAEQRRLLSAMKVELNRDQRIECWPREELSVTKVVT